MTLCRVTAQRLAMDSEDLLIHKTGVVDGHRHGHCHPQGSLARLSALLRDKSGLFSCSHLVEQIVLDCFVVLHSEMPRSVHICSMLSLAVRLGVTFRCLLAQQFLCLLLFWLEKNEKSLPASN